MAVVGRQHQQGIAIVVAQVGRQALGQQRGEHGGITFAGHIEDLFGKFGGFVFAHSFGVV